MTDHFNPTTSTVSVLALLLSSVAAFADSGIHGRVTGQNEAGRFAGMVPSASIEILSESGVSVAKATANARGYYKISLPPGRYYYKVTAEGFRDEDAGRGLKIDRADGLQVFNFSLTKGENNPDRVKPVYPERKTGELHGRVLERTSDGDVGIPNAQITFVNKDTREIAEVIVSPQRNKDSVAGSYRISLAAGSWQAAVRAKGFDRHVEESPIEITDGADAQKDFILTKYEPPAEVLAAQGIKGTVLIEKGGRTYPPPFAVQLHVIRTSDQAVAYEKTTAISESKFSFDTMPGSYRVVASAADSEFTKAVSAPVFVFPRRFSNVQLVMRTAATEEETPEPAVVDDHPETQPGDSDSAVIEVVAINRRNKQPLLNAEILLRQISDQSGQVRTELTDKSGTARFTVPEGRYFVVARLSGFEVVAATPIEGFLRGRLVLSAIPKQTTQATFVMDHHTEPPVTNDGAIVEVYDAKMGTQLYGATVALARGSATPMTQTTDTGGIAAFSAATAGDYSLSVSLAGYYPVTRRIQFDPLKPRHRVAMYRTPTDIPSDTHGRFTVTGAVLFQPEVGYGTALIDGAELRWSGPTTVTAISGPLGAYSVSVPAGIYTVAVTAPAGSGFESRTFAAVSVTHNETRNFELRRSSTVTPLAPQIRVTVTDAITRRPITGAHVDLQRRGAGSSDGTSGTTASSGQVNLFAGSSGEYLVVASAAGYTSQRKVVTLSAGIINVVSMALPPHDGSTSPRMVDVSGWVVTLKSMKSDGRFSSGERFTLKPSGHIPDWTRYDPVPDAAVLWQFPAEGGLPGAMRMVRTDRSGHFIMQNLPEQVYSVTVNATGFDSLRTRIEVRDGMSDLWLVLNRADVIPPPDIKMATVRIQVVDQTQKGVPNATVTVMEGSRRLQTGTTDGSGYFQTQLAAGAYAIKASGSGFNPGGTTVKVGTQDTTATIRVTRSVTPPPSTQTATVRIHVIDQTQKGVPNATVTVMEGSRRLRTGTTDGSGYFQTQLAPGAYAVKASGTGINPGGTTVNVGSFNTTATINVTQSITPGSSSAATSLNYIAQYLPPGRTAWVTIGTYNSRSEAETAVKLAKVPVKSKTRVIPSSKGSPIRLPLKLK